MRTIARRCARRAAGRRERFPNESTLAPEPVWTIDPRSPEPMREHMICWQFTDGAA